MQLLTIGLYHHDGRVRDLHFRPGELNVVTGRSRTGKSALLTIVDYCLGRDKVAMPPGPIRKYVAWFVTLWLLPDGSRVLLGRPALNGVAETNQMMLSFGGERLTLPRFDELLVNSDSKSARALVGARLGLVDAQAAAAEGGLRDDRAITLGAAAFFMFQEQQEVASKTQLFHRQNSQGVSETIKDSLPYFLGVQPGDTAAKHRQLRALRRALRASQRELQAILDESQEMGSRLQVLLAEAHEAGLVSVGAAPSERLALELLNEVRAAPVEPLSRSADVDAQDRRRQLDAERRHLRGEIGQLLDERALLMDFRDGEDSYGSAIAQQAGRLSSLGLLSTRDGAVASSHEQCPVCLSRLEGEDPIPSQLSQRLASLRSELELVAQAVPARRTALERIDGELRARRERLLAVEQVFDNLESADSGSNSRTGAERRSFVRGRIDAVLDQYRASDTSQIAALESRISSLDRSIDALARELDDALAHYALTKAVGEVSRRITELAVALEVEYAEHGVYLDVSKLTVVLETEDGPATLEAMGSGANWLGLHLAVHLALHEWFVQKRRPVPNLLMFDQPTQVFYESATSGPRPYVGEDENTADDDHDAVARMFRLMSDVVGKLSPNLQIIVSDHANLTETWFTDSVRYNWRGGDALIPADWFGETSQEPTSKP